MWSGCSSEEVQRQLDENALWIANVQELQNQGKVRRAHAPTAETADVRFQPIRKYGAGVVGFVGVLLDHVALGFPPPVAILY